MSNNFKILKEDKKTRARLGVLTTPHGMVNTPSYVFVGTYGRFLHLSPSDLKKTKIQIVISNTFHLWHEVLKTNNHKLPATKLGTFIHNKLGLKVPIMTDSGGFQVLSLAFGDKNKVSKFMTGDTQKDDSFNRSKIKITQRGVHFNYNGQKMFLSPKMSMDIQRRIGADINFAFDHITSPLDDYEYNKHAIEVTNKWARICLKEHAKGNTKQLLFGIVQGGIFKNLRKASAKYIGSLPFDGFGIGGSYTKKQISKTLKWMIPHLPAGKPRHLLGVGKVADIFEAVENGIDLFDCVIPTREARHGRLYTKTGHMDIRRGYYSKDKKVIERNCGCHSCKSKIPRSKIRELIKSVDRKQNAAGQRWCLLHNIWFFNNLVEEMRSSIQKGTFLKLKKKYLSPYDI